MAYFLGKTTYGRKIHLCITNVASYCNSSGAKIPYYDRINSKQILNSYLCEKCFPNRDKKPHVLEVKNVLPAL
jgi:hypothetical protein